MSEVVFDDEVKKVEKMKTIKCGDSVNSVESENKEDPNLIGSFGDIKKCEDGCYGHNKDEDDSGELEVIFSRELTDKQIHRKYKRTNLGAHIPSYPTLSKTIDAANELGMYSIQIFNGSPLVYKRKTFKLDDITEAKEKVGVKHCQYVFSHLPYLYNCAGNIKQNLLWSTTRNSSWNNIVSGVNHELDLMSNFRTEWGGGGCILHPGSWPKTKEGIQSISYTINSFKFKPNSLLLLEINAGRGSCLGVSIEELKSMYDGVSVDLKENVGICIDTAHIYASPRGGYDLSQTTQVVKMFEKFDLVFGLRKLNLIHLNDSMVGFKAGDDKHALIGTGHIWGNSTKSLSYLLDYTQKFDIPVVLETSPSDYPVIQSL